MSLQQTSTQLGAVGADLELDSALKKGGHQPLQGDSRTRGVGPIRSAQETPAISSNSRLPSLQSLSRENKAGPNGPAQKIIEALEESKDEAPFLVWSTHSASPHVGERTALALANQFPSIEELAEAPVERLQETEEGRRDHRSKRSRLLRLPPEPRADQATPGGGTSPSPGTCGQSRGRGRWKARSSFSPAR